MDGVDEPCSPTPPTGHQHQSGHLMCYESRTSSRAIDSMRSATCDTQHEMRCRASPSRARPSAQPSRLLQKVHQRRAVFGADDDLLRHLRAGRVARRADLKEFLDGLGVPDDIELFERLGKIIAGRGSDAAAEDAVRRRAGAVAVVRIERMAGGASLEYLGPAVALEGGEHVL